MLSRLDLDTALTGNVEVARDMRDTAQEKMSLMKNQIQVLQNKTAEEKKTAVASKPKFFSSSRSMPILPTHSDSGDDAVEAQTLGDDFRALSEATKAAAKPEDAPEQGREDDGQRQQGADSDAAAQGTQNLPGVPIDAG